MYLTSSTYCHDFGAGSCELAGYTTCCSISIHDNCLGSDYACHCDTDCYKYGDCCTDIHLLNCCKLHEIIQTLLIELTLLNVT